MLNVFIEQTARDYDIPIHEVERIARLFPNDFYSKLEGYISDRANKHNQPTTPKPTPTT